MMSRRQMFVVLWAGIGLSIIGSELTEFGLGLWLLGRENGSVVDYTILYVCLETPVLVLTPLVGFLLDRFDKLRVLFCAEVLSALLSASMLLLDCADLLVPAFTYGYIAICSVCTAVQIDGYATLVFRLVDDDDLARANAMSSLTDSLPQMLCPLLGGLIFLHGGLGPILGFDVVTLCVSATCIATLFRFSATLLASDRVPSAKVDWRGLFPSREAVEHVRARPELRRLVGYTGYKYFFVAGFTIALIPYLASRLNGAQVGQVMAEGGAAMVVTSLIAGWRPTLPQALPLPLLDLLYAAGIVGLAFATDNAARVLFIALSFACLRLGIIKLQTLWHRSVDGAFQGRVYALRNLVKKLAYIVCYSSAGLVIEALVRRAPLSTAAAAWDGYRVYFAAFGATGLVVFACAALAGRAGAAATRAEA